MIFLFLALCLFLALGRLYIHSLLQSLARLEGRILGSGNLQLLAGLRIAAGTGSTLLDLKSTKAQHLNLVTGY